MCAGRGEQVRSEDRTMRRRRVYKYNEAKCQSLSMSGRVSRTGDGRFVNEWAGDVQILSGDEKANQQVLDRRSR